MIREYNLGDCIEKVIDYRGKTPAKFGGDWVDDGIRVISALNVHDGTIDNQDQIRCVSKDIYDIWMQEEINRYDCFLASEGASLGENAIWDSDEKVVLGQRLYAIRTNPQILDPGFFAMYMQTKKFRNQVDQVSTGSTVFGISQPVLLSLKLLLPEIDEQRKIGELYRNTRDRFLNNNSVCLDLESMVKLLYDYWFVQFDFPDENGKPYKSSGGKMVWNEQLNREIPEGWEVKPTLDVFSWIGTSQPPKATFAYAPKDGYIRFIQNRDYDGDDHVTFIPLTEGTKTCTEFDIMMDKYGDAGRTRFGIAGAYNVALSKIDVHDSHMREYVRAYLNSETIYNYLHSACIASTRASLNEANFSFLSIAIPPTDVLKAFDSIVSNVIETILAVKKENHQLASLRDFLLPMLMNGQVKVS